MEDMQSLIKKPQTSGTLESTKNLSDVLSPRQIAVSALIQRTQTRRGLPLISAGFELRNVIAAWEDALKAVPDSYLSRSYERAAENFPWLDKAFTADAVADAYKILLVEDRQRAEADKRNALRRNPDTYKCFHCCDEGYQHLFYHDKGLWYSSVRPCSCEAAPVGQRQQFALGLDWVRSKLGEYARQSEIEKYGAPNESFKGCITSK